MVTAMTPTSPPVRTARTEAEQIDQLLLRLKQHHPAVDPETIQVVRSPLRICPLGAHIDHQLGRVTGMTINQSVLLAFAPAPDGQIWLDSLNFGPPVTFNIDQVPPYQPRDWGNYIRGAILALRQNYQLRQGLIGVVGGDMPIGGLSSSAAVTIAYLLALEAIHHLAVSPEQNIGLVRFTENHYIGLNNGVLDQSVILRSRQNDLTVIDCQTMQIDNAPLQPSPTQFEILVVYSGVTQVLVGTDYNNRVAECQEAARSLLTCAGQEVMEAPRLRQVEPEIFQQFSQQLPPTLKRRATHYFGEMERVAEGIQAWQSGDLSRFGRLMSESGESSIKYYECGSPQLITLYELLREIPGVYGVRFSGAGFRGNCIALIDPAAREAVAEAVHRRYPVEHPGEADLYSIHFCQPDGHARLLSGRL
jgi:galactokinase